MPDALAAAYDVLLLDLDGVVYIGGTAIPGAPEALQQASADGAHLAYVTNNASRTPAAVAAMLTGMGVPAKAADVVTSAQAAARLLAEKLPPKAKVLVIGALALRLAIRERGLTPGLQRRRGPAGGRPGVQPRRSATAASPRAAWRSGRARSSSAPTRTRRSPARAAPRPATAPCSR